jgi:hypothetical protein
MTPATRWCEWFEREAHEIKYGAAGRFGNRSGVAVFVHEGQLVDVFTPGLFAMLRRNADHDDVAALGSRVQIAVQIGNLLRQHDTVQRSEIPKNPIMLRDPEFADPYCSLARTAKVTDPAKFLTETRAPTQESTMDGISFQIRSTVQAFTRTIAASGIAWCWIWPPTPPIWAN